MDWGHKIGNKVDAQTNFQFYLLDLNFIILCRRIQAVAVKAVEVGWAIRFQDQVEKAIHQKMGDLA